MFQDSMKNKKAFKFILIGVLAGVLAFSQILTGCGVGGAAGSKRETSGNKVEAPVAMDFLVQNNLNVKNVKVGEDGDEVTGTYLEVSGLLDKEVEKKINETIYKTFDKALNGKEIAPYRGIKKLLNGVTTPSNVYVNVTQMSNANNILSLLTTRNVNFSNDLENGTANFLECITLNFDLNTGKQLTLADMFADNVDYMKYVNETVSKELASSNADEENIYDSGSGLKIASPFETILENQKFYIDGYNGDLVLVFDYDTPEFYTGLFPAFLIIDNCDKMAFTERVYDGSSIFKDKKVVCSLLPKPYDRLSLIQGDGYTTPLGEETNFSLSTFSRYFEDMPKSLLAIAKKYEHGSTAIENESKKIYSQYVAEYDEADILGSCYYSMYVDRIGDYTSINSSQSVTVAKNPGYNVLYNFSNDVYRCYKGDSDKVLQLENVFRKGIDYKVLIKDAFKANMEKYDEKQEVKWEKADEIIDRLMENMTGFYVGQSALFFSYSNPDQVIKDILGDGAEIWQHAAIYSSADYRNIGCENMTIFD